MLKHPWQIGRQRPFIWLAFLFWSVLSGALPGQEKRAVDILFLGDSNTYAGDYVAMAEVIALLQGERGSAGWLNLGLPSETVSGLSEPGHAGGAFPRPDLHERLGRVLETIAPRQVVACYGMNCGIYHPFSEERFQAFQTGIRRLHEAVKAAGANLILLTPPLFDVEPIEQRTLPLGAERYDRPYHDYDTVLDRYSAWIVEAAEQEGWKVCDARPQLKAFLAAERARDPKFTFAPDGVHLNEQGHWLIARELARQLCSEPTGVNFAAQRFAEAFPEGSNPQALLVAVRERQRLLCDCYLSLIGHQRPGMARGLPPEEAERKAIELEARVTELVTGLRRHATRSAEPVMVCTDAGAGGYEAFPDVCRLKDGRLLCVFYAGYGHVALPTEKLPKGGRIACCYSADEGKRWSAAETVYDGPDDDRDPSIVQLQDGRLLCNFFSLRRDEASPRGFRGLGSWLVESADGGLTWSEPRQLSETHYCSSPIRELRDGRLIVGLYVQNEGVSQGSVVYSDDGGKSWQPEVLIDNGGMKLDAETDIVELKDGTLFAAQRPEMAWSRSEDRGATWSISKRLGFTGHCPYFLRTSEGVIVLAYRLPQTSLRFSRDECQSWSENVVVDQVGGAYPSMVNLRDGSVLIVYYEEGAGSSIRARRFRIDESGLKWLPIGD